MTFLRTLSALESSSEQDSILTPQQAKARLQRGWSTLSSSFGSAPTKGGQGRDSVFTFERRDSGEFEARMLRLKALVLLTQPAVSLYNHALLLYEVVFDDYQVREALKEACQEEIR